MTRLIRGGLDAQVLAITAVVVIWFVSFPEDLEAVITPVRQLLALVSEVLQLTNSISPFAYGLAAVAVISTVWKSNRGARVTGNSQP